MFPLDFMFNKFKQGNDPLVLPKAKVLAVFTDFIVIYWI